MLGVRIGIDFGSTNITLCEDDRGIVISEPSVVICDSYTGRPIAVGAAAKKMIGKLPGSMRAVYPIKDGIVNDFEMARFMLKTYIDRLCRSRLFKPNILMSVPGSVTDLEKKTILDVIYSPERGGRVFLKRRLPPPSVRVSVLQSRKVRSYAI